jgi:imidazolonepropionase-like amidohydrolase
MPVVVSVNRASDIAATLKLAQHFGLRLVIEGGAEAWMVADQLAKAQVPVLLNPLQDLPDSFDTLGSTLENAARLNKAGVMIAFETNDSHNARNIKQAAGNAVAYGLPYTAALAAMTINPAKIYGIESQVGRLVPGTDADVVIWSGDPLEVTSFADAVFIRGQQIPMVSRATQLRDRYMQYYKAKGAVPPQYLEH